jgi:hypothetical protein
MIAVLFGRSAVQFDLKMESFKSLIALTINSLMINVNRQNLITLKKYAK